MVRFHHVTKTYARTHTHALKNVDFHVRKGEFVYITGHSGAGKSTLLALVLRRVLATEGSVHIAGQDVAKIRQSRLPQLRRTIGMVFQDHRLLPKLSALDNLAFTLRATGQRGNLEQRALHSLRLVGLAHKRKAFPIELSLGEQQRVAIARCLVTRPPIVIADEPTGNLDPDTGWETMNLLVRINASGTTVLIATHNRELVNTMRRRVISLDAGRIVRDEIGGGYSG